MQKYEKKKQHQLNRFLVFNVHHFRHKPLKKTGIVLLSQDNIPSYLVFEALAPISLLFQKNPVETKIGHGIKLNSPPQESRFSLQQWVPSPLTTPLCTACAAVGTFHRKIPHPKNSLSFNIQTILNIFYLSCMKVEVKACSWIILWRNKRLFNTSKIPVYQSNIHCTPCIVNNSTDNVSDRCFQSIPLHKKSFSTGGL